MSPERPDRDLDAAPPWARRLLRAGRVARLATVDAEGQPSVVAICYVLVGRALYSPIDGKPKSTTRLRRVRDLEANPRVALVVDHWDEDWRRLAWVSVRGRGVVLDQRDSVARREAIEALRDKYPQYDAGEAGAPLAEDAPVIRIEIGQTRWWRASTETEA